MNILLTCAGRRHYLASYFQETLAGYGKVVGTDMTLSAPALQACDVMVKVPSVFAENYISSLKDIIIKENINMLFSLNDLEIALLVEHQEQLEAETGATLYVPHPDTLKVCTDKWLTYCFAQQLGIDAPATYLNVEDAKTALEANELSFPLIIKPRWGSASIGLFIVDSLEELSNSFMLCQQAINKSALVSLGSKDTVIIQDLIQGAEYGVDLLYGKKSNFIGFTAKKKLAMRAGETDKAVTVEPTLFEDLVNKISSAIQHRGNLDCDFLERDGRLYLLEFNPRFGGGYPFTHLSGANHVQMLIDDYQDKPLSSYSYQVGQGFAKCDTLVQVPIK